MTKNKNNLWLGLRRRDYISVKTTEMKLIKRHNQATMQPEALLELKQYPC